MKRTVIIVDDSGFLVKKLQDFFQDSLDYDVLATGSNGMQAVELYREHKPDLITLDITMPIKDGKDALAEIMAEFPGARAMIISAVTGSTILSCIKLGAKGYVEKPLRFDDEDFQKDFRDTLAEVFAAKTGN